MQEVVGAVGRLDSTVAGLSHKFDELKATTHGLKNTVDDLRVVVARIEAQLPYLASKTDLAEKPSKTYMWGILAVLLTAYACGLAGLAILK